MKTSDFDYELPEGLIARFPVRSRDQARLLILDRKTGYICHRKFKDLIEFVTSNDRLIVNDTKVLPARLFCRNTKGAEIELLFIKKFDDNCWRVMANPGRKLKKDVRIMVDKDSSILFFVNEICDDGNRIVSLVPHRKYKSIIQVLEKHGHIPLPPYIKRPDIRSDRENYQTVYAKQSGAVAAPTAGLHFTEKLIRKLKNRGVSFSNVTLHVGAGTFAPVKVPDPRKHVMHTEDYELSMETAGQINETSRSGGRVIAVGTTVVRVLEHCAGMGIPLVCGHGETSLLILEGYAFRAVDALITNFHLPCSTLLMLVCAFGGKDNVMAAYEEAIRMKYRFYSYGDAMMIL
jgi:S-adenosylmethionine:tRNA ribosyltransferase-isomerase